MIRSIKSGISGDNPFVACANSIRSDLGIPPGELECQAQLANHCIGFALFVIISSFTSTGFDFHPAFPIENGEEDTR